MVEITGLKYFINLTEGALENTFCFNGGVYHLNYDSLSVFLSLGFDFSELSAGTLNINGTTISINEEPKKQFLLVHLYIRGLVSADVIYKRSEEQTCGKMLFSFKENKSFFKNKLLSSKEKINRFLSIVSSFCPDYLLLDLNLPVNSKNYNEINVSLPCFNLSFPFIILNKKDQSNFYSCLKTKSFSSSFRYFIAKEKREVAFIAIFSFFAGFASMICASSFARFGFARSSIVFLILALLALFFITVFVSSFYENWVVDLNGEHDKLRFKFRLLLFTLLPCCIACSIVFLLSTLGIAFNLGNNRYLCFLGVMPVALYLFVCPLLVNFFSSFFLKFKEDGSL
jgi:hypothetical protein